ncbi:MAG: DUF3526 domain-containing protein [Chryseobacterium sp.]|nr:MAG: DUF3526 domain-containing protein [Chryseobacterium sp.]
MIRTIAQKEFYSALRDKRFMVFAIIIFILLFTSIISGYKSYSILQAERNLAQHHAEEDFHSQPDRHPHRVAHYGSYAFRPKSALSFLDAGLDPYTGTMVYLEAHQQNSANFSQAQQSNTLIRIGEMTMAFVMQWLMPLLIIFLCFNAFTQERENGTLKLLMSQGISIQQIAKGKIMGFSLLITIVIFPAFLIAILTSLVINNEPWNFDTPLRLFTMLLSYAAYFFIFITGSVLISSLCKQSKTALIALLGCWIFFCVVIPKLTVSLGDALFQTPSKAAMDAAIHRQAKNGINGHDDQDKRTKEFTEKLLKKYGVDSASQLPVNLGGLVMAEGEAFSSKLYQKHFDELVNTYEKQNNISKWSGFLNPYQSIRAISMSMAGSDFRHYVTFLNAAESYRFKLAQHLNHLQAYKLANKAKDTRLDKSEYNHYPEFSYNPPTFWQVLFPSLISIFALYIWALGIYILCITILKNISIL